MKRLRPLGAVVLLSALGLVSHRASAVPVGVGGGAACTVDQLVSCSLEGGTGEVRSNRCVCVITEYTPAYVSNADRGDVGLVPVNDGKGEETVRAVMDALNQNHRHAVMYLDSETLRHNTSYTLEDSDVNWTFGGLRIQPGVLMNGQPGIMTESVDDALDAGWNRLGQDGLVLKPGRWGITKQSLDGLDPIKRVSSDRRGSNQLTIVKGNLFLGAPSFAAAADKAETLKGYYKISDYSGLTGMALPYAGDLERDDLRGTMCSGFVYEAFTKSGYSISKHTYSSTVRDDVAQAVWDSVHDQVNDSMGAWLVLFPQADEELPNQVVNCFAGLACDDTSDTWESGVGSGSTVSPDNLLPKYFTLYGRGSYDGWGGVAMTSGTAVDNSVYGATTTPFRRVEIQNLVGSVYSETVLTTW
jgi:hypothetical protein